MNILLTKEQICHRVGELGREITDYYHGEPILIVAVLNGAMLFVSDLIREIDGDVYLDSIAVQSYSNDQSSGKVHLRSSGKLSVEGKHLLLIDDIFDTGLTLHFLYDYYKNQGALSVRSCVFLEKDIKKKIEFKPDWIGFKVPNIYLVGYGLDSKEQYRQLPEVCFL